MVSAFKTPEQKFPLPSAPHRVKFALLIKHTVPLTAQWTHPLLGVSAKKQRRNTLIRSPVLMLSALLTAAWCISTGMPLLSIHIPPRVLAITTWVA